jgi:hypothetical protein
VRDALRPAAVALTLIVVLLVGAAARAQGRDIEVGAFVTSLSDINPDDGSFRIVFYAWFNDPAGQFDIERHLTIDARTASIGAVSRETSPSGGSYTYARIEAQAPHEFDFRRFPFDAQTLRLRMEPSEDAETLRFVPDVAETGASPDLALRGWQIGQIRISVEDRTYESDFGYWAADDRDVYSTVVLEIDITRHRSPVILDDFIGFTFAFLVTCLSFFVSCTELGLRIGMATGSLFAAVVNLNRLHDAAGFRPEFAFVDRLAFLVFGAILSALVIAIGTHRLSKRDAPRANRIDSALGLALFLVFGTLIALTLRASLA